MGVVRNERYYNGAAVADLATTNITPLAAVPAALGDAADRAETQAKLAALEADLVQVATKLNLVLTALEEAGTISTT